jgi:nucleotide-binding universal stress UspA family protein
MARTILCPIDFSESSRGALRYAALIAAHLEMGLTVATVNDPLLSAAADMAGSEDMASLAARELERFVRDTWPAPPPLAHIKYALAAGKPAAEILGMAARTSASLIVLSSQGATGVRKLFIGSTAERVLRETTVPVVIIPAGVPATVTLDVARNAVRRILLPVDLSGAMTPQLLVATAVAVALGASLLLLHVVEPVRTALPGYRLRPSADAERRHRAERHFERVLQELPSGVKAEALVVFGEPAEEIARVAAAREVGLIVMGLQASPLLGSHMGSVTFRVLCLARVPVVALPPVPPAPAEETSR